MKVPETLMEGTNTCYTFYKQEDKFKYIKSLQDKVLAKLKHNIKFWVVQKKMLLNLDGESDM